MPEAVIVPAYSSPITVTPDAINKASEYEDFVSLWMMSKEIDQRNQWFKGDIVDKVAVKYGEESLQKFAESVGEKYDTIIVYRRVSRAFPVDKRMYNTGWTHYFQATYADKWDKGEGKFETEKRFDWIAKAAEENWSLPKMKMEMAEHKAQQDGDLYTFYLQGIVRFGNIITHWKKEGLGKTQKDMLVQNLEGVVDDFKEYLDDSAKE